MEEVILKCDYCGRSLINKHYHIELKEKVITRIIDPKKHFCDRHCLIAYLTCKEDKGE